MANSELFICGDARFLSGGAARCQDSTYNNAPPVVTPGNEVTTTRVAGLVGTPNKNAVHNALSTLGQSIRRGRDSYHQHSWHPGSSSMVPNVFVTPGAAPTVGVEIETYVRPEVTVDMTRNDLVSNWFHFEEDGSLDRSVGHELITDVLTPRHYRDIRLWVGLQNLVSPYLESYSKSSTGLHVHVGVNQFDECDALPVSRNHDRRALAKYAVALVYYGLLSKEYLDKVFLRKNGSYCSERADNVMTSLASIIRSRKEGMKASEIFDHMFSAFYVDLGRSMTDACMPGGLVSTVISSGHVLGGTSSGSGRSSSMNFPSSYSSHGVELNFEHPFTLEFRRGKGTTNAVSVHRMVELCTLVVRYVWHLARNPDEYVSTESVYSFIMKNTNSEALKKITEKQLARFEKGGKESETCA